MARPRKETNIEGEIRSQEVVVTKAKQKYDTEVAKLKVLYAKREEVNKKTILKSVEISGKTYEEKCKRRMEENGNLLEMFMEDLEGVNPKTINRHLDNVEFYINTYLLREDACDFTQGIWKIDDYLGYFFIQKCMWSTPGNIKSTAASIKKFYQCMLKHEMIQKSDYKYLCEVIKENMWKWQSECEIYNDPDAENITCYR